MLPHIPATADFQIHFIVNARGPCPFRPLQLIRRATVRAIDKHGLASSRRCDITSVQAGMFQYRSSASALKCRDDAADLAPRPGAAPAHHRMRLPGRFASMSGHHLGRRKWSKATRNDQLRGVISTAQMSREPTSRPAKRLGLSFNRSRRALKHVQRAFYSIATAFGMILGGAKLIASPALA